MRVYARGTLAMRAARQRVGLPPTEAQRTRRGRVRHEEMQHAGHDAVKLRLGRHGPTQ